MIREVIFYQTENGNCPVEKFIRSLDVRTRSKIAWVIQFVEDYQIVPTKFLKKLSGIDDIWEVRIEYSSNIYRLLGFIDNGSLIVLTNGFQKKKYKIERKEIEIAIRYKKNYLERRIRA